MSKLMPDPTLVLETMEDVRTFIENPVPARQRFKHPERRQIKALWLMELLDELAAGPVTVRIVNYTVECGYSEVEIGGHRYVGNSCLKRLAEQRLGYPLKTEAEYASEGDDLSLLVYNAHGYRTSDKLKADGFVEFTQELIDETGIGGRLETPGGKKYIIREIGGEVLAMELRSQTKFGVPGHGNPIKVTKKGKPKRVKV